MDLGMGRFRKGRKDFFSEEKKQKTFHSWDPTFPERSGPMNESFLVLFFKKELLA
jgi:hypothetical protein